MNIKTINIGNPEKALEDLAEIKNKNYGNVDIKIENLHLKRINVLIRKNVFKKNDAYISAETLWEVMKEQGEEGKHHFHGLNEGDVVNGLSSITNPLYVIKTDLNRYSLISSFISSFGYPLIKVIELNAGLVNDQKAFVNKIVTIYPKDEIDKYVLKLPKENVLYKNKV